MKLRETIPVKPIKEVIMSFQEDEFEELGSGPMQFRKWALWDKNDVVYGTMDGYKHDTYKGKPTIGINIKVTKEVTFDDYKGNPIEVGSVLSLSPATILNNKIDEYEVAHGENSILGKLIRVEYLGKGTTKEGNPVNTFSFKVAKSKVLEPENIESVLDDDL